MNDEALLARQAELQREAAAFVDGLGLLWSAGVPPEVESFQPSYRAAVAAVEDLAS